MQQLEAFAKRLTAALRLVVSAAVIVFYSYMAVAVLLQVLGRYVFNYSIDWSTETATFAQIWMVLLAAGVAMQQRLHVGVDILLRALPVQLQRVVIAIVTVICLGFLLATITASMPLLRIGQIQTSPALAIPMWLPYLSLPIGLSYFAFEFVLAMFASLRNPEADQSPAAAQ